MTDIRSAKFQCLIQQPEGSDPDVMRLMLLYSILRILLNKRNCELNKCFIVSLIPTESKRGYSVVTGKLYCVT